MPISLYSKIISCAAFAFCLTPAHGAVVISQVNTADGGLATNQLTSITGNTHLVGDTRLFLATKTGRITAYQAATDSFTPFLDLTASVAGATSSTELGLLGLAFDPGYATNGAFYAYYTSRATPTGPIEAQVGRFYDSTIASGTASTVWRTDLDGATNHVGGWIDFDKSGKLLIAIGDGGKGSASDIRNTGQNPADWFGSILRVDPNVDAFPADAARNYGIPGDNPLIAGGAPEVFAYGVRNPFRNSVAPDGSLIIADVGQNAREEITVLGASDPNRNLGWALREGDIATPGVGGPPPADYQAPDFVYDHSKGDKAVIGGFVYRGTAVPELYGRYVFGDQVSGNIWSVAYAGGTFVAGSERLIGNIPSLVSFGETMSGELVATQFSFGRGRIFAFGSDGVAAVPEPRSWALMIGGFAMAGGMLRRRGSAQAARRA